MKRLAWSIAWRYMRTRRESALLSFISMIAVLGVIVGVSALIVVIAVMNGMQIDLREKLLIGSPDLRVLGYGENVRMANWHGALDTVRKQPGVVVAAPFVLTDAMVLNSAGYQQGVQLQGLPPEQPGVLQVTDIRKHAVQGDFRFLTSEGTRRGAVLGIGVAQRMLVRVGDTITVFSSAGVTPQSVMQGVLPRMQTFVVTGIVQTDMDVYDAHYVYVDLDVARELAGLGEDVTGIEIKTTDRDKAAAVGAQLDSVMGYGRRTEDWNTLNASLFSALRLEKLAMAIILLLIILVAAFNIVSTLTMVVHAKTREIGILKAMGLKAAAVRNVFLLQGLVIGLLGTSLGLALGLAVADSIDRYRLIRLDPAIYFIDHLPIRIQFSDNLLIVLASVAIATLATLHPARQASRLNPVEAIRAE